jgi:hypothetical protein
MQPALPSSETRNNKRCTLNNGLRASQGAWHLQKGLKLMTTSRIKWRVKYEPAKTVYTIQCHDILTLTYGFGDAIHPKDADFVANAERKDVPGHWGLWGDIEGVRWRQSAHDTKEAARAALRASRLAPPKPPWPIALAPSDHSS